MNDDKKKEIREKLRRLSEAIEAFIIESPSFSGDLKMAAEIGSAEGDLRATLENLDA